LTVQIPVLDKDAEACARALRELCGDEAPRVAVVLGSGLGEVAHILSEPDRLDYFDLPGFPHTAIEGHKGRVLAGTLHDVPILLLQGRVHYYESGRADAMAIPMQALKAAGCEVLLMTNAAGSLEAEAGPGSLMMITDHINFTGTNPLIGSARGGAAFVDMTEAYDPALQTLLRAAAGHTGLHLHEGVYACFSGPSFETPAEIKAVGILGANAVGMSLVPEAILARFSGLRVAAVSIITNYAAGISKTPLSHRQTMQVASEGAASVKLLVAAFLAGFAAGEA